MPWFVILNTMAGIYILHTIYGNEGRFVMLQGIVYCTVPALRPELEIIVRKFPSIDVQFINDSGGIKNILHANTVLFLLLSTEEINDIKSILQLYKRYPQSFLIFYHHSLNARHSTQSVLGYFSNIIIGDGRKKNLQYLLQDLNKTYWKKIPYMEMGLAYQNLSSRIKKVMHYIETHDLKECNSTNIAQYLNISKGYFSQEFKRETTINYREFMQNLLAYYERILFDQMDISAKAASQLLGYSELSSFSRSFKKRKGYPPSLVHKQII
jgi:AraC-like DNA-binding protein